MTVSALISPEWLFSSFKNHDLKLVDASWHLPNSGRDARAEFLQERIAGSVFFDLDAISDQSSALPHMLASPEQFSAAVGALGISHADTIVVYDSAGLFSAARAWWNFKIYGVEECFVLDGGLPAWKAANYPVATGPSDQPPAANFVAKPASSMVADANEVEASLTSDQAQIVDMRPAPRFSGEAAEPRPEARSGHMPGAINLPFLELVQDGRLSDRSGLRALLAERSIDPNRPIITSCGSGVTATILNLALFELGYDHMRVYDGSWAEWGCDARREVVTGNN